MLHNILNLMLPNYTLKMAKMANVTCCVFYHDKKRERETQMTASRDRGDAPTSLDGQMPREPPDVGIGLGRSPSEPPRKGHFR